MIKRIKKKYTKAQVLGSIDPIIKDWFNNNFKDLTDAQAYAIPLIHQGKNVLVASPTGSGKTLTAFLMIINELFELGRKNALENKVYCIYISPLKALANDIERNLNSPLKQIYELAAERGINLPEIRVNVRSGDTSTAARQKMVKKPPHILITTPESLSLIISTKRFRFKLLDTQFVIVDEIHEVCSSKRGVHLSISLERLQNQVRTQGRGQDFIRIGLSATQAPIREIAKFLVGYDKEQNLRDINIVEVPASKKLDLKVMCPVQDMNLIPFEIVNAKMYDILNNLIKTHRTTLIFTNTRSGAEAVVYKLHEQGLEDIAAHHGSLSKETRLDVEEKLKNGELDATICSTSLELGIDIGYIDLVCQVGSPKSIAKGLQRIGRAGHALHEVSKGRIIVFDRDDLVECAVLVKNAYESNIDRINILKNNLDVLAQGLIGMSLEQQWDLNEAYSIVKQSYSFHTLRKKDFLSVINYIGGKHSMEDRGVYGKVRFYPEEHRFGIRRGARIIYNLNIGTIPQEANYKVEILGTGYTVGVLSEKFVERLENKDVFVLGGKTYEFIQAKGMRVYVKDAHGRKPTVPSWTGEMLPRSFDLSCQVGKFRAELGRRLSLVEEVHTDNIPTTKIPPAAKELSKIEQWLRDEYYLDAGSAKSIINYFIEQRGIIKDLPTDHNVLIEGYIDGRGYRNIIFHFCFGRRVNDALARAYAYALSKKLNCTVRISVTDDNYMLSFPKRIELLKIPQLVTSDSLQSVLRSALRNTELFKQRFRHCAMRSFMILRNYKGREISVRKQMKRSHRILDIIHGMDTFPIINESYNEIMHDTMDIKHAEEVIKKIESGQIKINYSDYSKIPSPFAHNIVLIGISDIILMEDRSALLRELHQQVLGKVFSDFDVSKPKFELEAIRKHFVEKFPVVKNKSGLYSILKEVGPLYLFKEKGKNIFSFIPKSVSRAQVHTWANDFINNKKLISIIRNNNVYWLPHEHLDYYIKIYSNYAKLTDTEELVLKWLTAAGSKGRVIPSRFRHDTKGVLKDSPIEVKKLGEIIKRLEKRLLIHRLREKEDGSITWFVDHDRIRFGGSGGELIKHDSVQKIDFDSAIDYLIIQYLKYYAPAPVSELAFDLALEEELIARVLTDLVDTGQIVSGNFVLGKDLPQYMLALDSAILEQQQKPREKRKLKDNFIDEWTVQKYLVNKHFEPVGNIREFFDKFGSAFGLREIFIRTREFSMAKWNKFITGPNPKIVFGRFLNGRVCYIPTAEIPIYVSAYREAQLTNQDKTVLNIIKRHRAITRQELSKKLDARSSDLKEIIEKLERNLYIIREPPNYNSYLKVNKYRAYELKNRIKDSKLEIIRRLLKGHSPMNAYEIKNYTGFSDEFVHKCLDILVITGEVVKFKLIGENDIDMYIPAKEFELIKNMERTPEDRNKVKILSPFDSYTPRFMTEFRMRFGDGWQAPVVYFGKLVGALELWRLADCVEIRDIILDEELIGNLYKHKLISDSVPGTTENERINYLKLNLLEQILKELDGLMGYYGMRGLDIIRLRSVFGHEIDSLPVDIENILTKAGYIKLQRFFAKGKLDTNVFNFNQIIQFILQNQHILPDNRFTNPLELIRTMGGIRSNFEMQLRLDGDFYDIREFRKNLNLAAGPIIPEFYTYCTNKDLRIYKTAKGRELDHDMEYILENIPNKYSISSKHLFARLTLSQEQYNHARKQLYNGLFIVRDPMNKYVKVQNYRNMSKQYARKYVIKRIMKNFGIFNIEWLSNFTKHEFNRDELRELLHELEAEGEVTKGFLLEDDDTLFWMYNDGISKITSDTTDFDFDRRFIVSSQDQLATYLAPIIRKRFGFGSCFIIFHGLKISGVFRIKQKDKRVKVIDFIGDDDDWNAVETYFRKNGLEVIDEAAEELYSDSVDVF